MYTSDSDKRFDSNFFFFFLRILFLLAISLRVWHTTTNKSALNVLITAKNRKINKFQGNLMNGWCEMEYKNNKRYENIDECVLLSLF